MNHSMFRKSASKFNSLLLAVIIFQSNTWAQCADEWLDVDEIRDGGNIELRATNLQEYPITFSMRVKTKGLDADGPKSVTQTLQGSESETVMTLRENQDEHRGRYRIECDWTVGDIDAEHGDDQVYLFPYANESSYRLIQTYGSG